MIHSTHNIIHRQGLEKGVCTLCSRCACHDTGALALPCESTQSDVPLFKSTIPVYYEHGLTVNGQAEGVRKPDGRVVITVTLLDTEDANRILRMLEGKIPLALSWALRLMEVKRAPTGGNDAT